MMEIRNEQTTDIQAIHQLTEDAFAPMKFSDGTEPDVINALRASGDLTLSLVAIKDEVLVGHVAFSPVKVGDASKDWYGLGPVAVLPDLQRTGIGSALINKGLSIIQEMGANGCVLTGNPNYYCRFGFAADGKVSYGDTPDKNVMWLSFTDQEPTGEIIFNPAFEA